MAVAAVLLQTSERRRTTLGRSAPSAGRYTEYHGHMLSNANTQDNTAQK